MELISINGYGLFPVLTRQGKKPDCARHREWSPYTQTSRIYQHQKGHSTEMKAHQRIIREQEQENPTPDLFGSWWEGLDLTLNNTVIREIDRETCEAIILTYEWLGTMPPFIDKMYGIFFEGHCGGALVFSQRTEANLENAALSVIPPDARYLSRGACAHWTPMNTASYFISAVCNEIAPSTVLAYADITAGEIGQIYQALGWYHFKSNKTDAAGYIIDGKSISTRTLKSRFGTQDFNVIKQMYPASEIVKVPRKLKYVGVYGDRRWKSKWRKQLEPHSLPYPKRENVT
tara:strand:+ start:151 stop:1017 length:867 start_codon:yes stop_codon:yes gene_type:complete